MEEIYISQLLPCREKILKYLWVYRYARVADLNKEFRYSRQYIHREIKKLCAEGLVFKNGTPPSVLYLPTKKADVVLNRNFVQDRV